MEKKQNGNDAINKMMKDIESQAKILRLFMSVADMTTGLADSRDIAEIDFEDEGIVDEEDIIRLVYDTVNDYTELYRQVPETMDFCRWYTDEDNEHCQLNLYGFNLLMTNGISTGDRELDNKIHRAYRDLTNTFEAFKTFN